MLSYRYQKRHAQVVARRNEPCHMPHTCESPHPEITMLSCNRELLHDGPHAGNYHNTILQWKNIYDENYKQNETNNT